MADSASKRKRPSDQASGSGSKRPRFPMKPQHHIPAEPTRSAYPDGEINIKNFLKSHENEIKTLESAMVAAKKGLSRRAFQDVPRELRRRTASHNPNRVPKRLRLRAKQEAKEDNTPVTRGTSGSGVGKGKTKHLRKKGIEESRQRWEKRAAKRRENNGSKMDIDTESGKTAATKKAARPVRVRKFPSLAVPATPASRFRRRQRDKTWLPTHLWHSKRARMTDPKDPLWRFAIPLQPVTKAYRLTHRAASEHGAVAWDMSYMSTISVEGVEASITGLLKSLHFGMGSNESPWQSRGVGKKWRQGTRVWEGWLCERERRPVTRIAEATVIWSVPSSEETKRVVYMRIHPAAFLQLWNEVICVAKVQKPAVTVRDLRFEIGSIEVMGPAAAECLCSVLAPVPTKGASENTPEGLWSTLARVTDAASMPKGALLAFDISDPRLHDPPATSDVAQNQEALTHLTGVLASWPADETQKSPSIFDIKARDAAARCMPSQKAINRRKSACIPGQKPESVSTDPRIPMLLYVSRERRSWTVLLPWKYVMPVWRGITRYPISTGGVARFGGLKERRQIEYERSKPFFPYDYPGTEAGWGWELRQREARKREWTKKPKGKRIQWSTIDLGNDTKGEVGDPWACDWERLHISSSKTGSTPPTFQQLSSSQVNDHATTSALMAEHKQITCLFSAKLTMLQRGVPTGCTRIYRMPSSNPELKQKWMSLQQKPGPKSSSKLNERRAFTTTPEHIQRRDLARSLLEHPAVPTGPPKAGDETYPAVPGEEDLIGFVTTGNYNLAEGIPTAVANIALHKVTGEKYAEHGLQHEDSLCIMRQAGSTIGRIARWTLV